MIYVLSDVHGILEIFNSEKQDLLIGIVGRLAHVRVDGTSVFYSKEE